MQRPETKQIYIQTSPHGKGSMTFYLPDAINDDVPQPHWRKIISFILDVKKERWFAEDDFAPVLEEWFDYLVYQAKDDWNRTSRIYQSFYCNPSRGTSKKKQASIRAHNKRMIEEVKRCKTRYEKCVKRKELFKEFRENQG